MSRVFRVGAAQLGPLQRSDTRQVAVDRMLALLDQANRDGCNLVVFPELALTTFFPRWNIDDRAEIDAYFESEMPNAATQRLFDRARECGIAMYIGYAEIAEVDGARHRFNTSILIDREGGIVGKYRKTHLPGHARHDPERAFQHLEKKYFEVGDTGFRVWRTMGGLFGMCICNDRRWPESYRVMGLQGVEMVLLGFNTPSAPSFEPSTMIFRFKPGPIRMGPGSSPWPRRGMRTGTTFSAARRSFIRRGKSSPARKHWATS